MQLQVLFEDNHLIAVNKPAGALSQSDETGDSTIADWVKNYIKQRYNKPGEVFLGTVHRLDRPVSGVLLFARTSKALERMNKVFRDREIDKVYWAIVSEQPQEFSATLVDYIWKDGKKNRAKALDKENSNRHANAKRAELTYQVVGRVASNVLLEVKPATGRPHQIRVQLAKAGMPIRGDLKYGYANPTPDGNIMLHSRSLSFVHPVKQEPVLITADPYSDNDIWRMFDSFWR